MPSTSSAAPARRTASIGRPPRARSRARSAISPRKPPAEGYKIGQTPIPYHGYYYRILKRQGGSAPGGAYDYVVKGKMIGGFALIAYPAEYGNSGIMTFMVNQDGTVFQKDFGPATAKRARAIEAYAPDQSWTKVDAAK